MADWNADAVAVRNENGEKHSFNSEVEVTEQYEK